MTIIDISQFPRIKSEPQKFKLEWYKANYPFKYSEGVHYFIQKNQDWIIDEIAKWVKENHCKENFPPIIDWKLKVNLDRSATLTCKNRQNAAFKFNSISVFETTDIELFYGGDCIDEVVFCLYDIADPFKMELMLEEERIHLLAIASRLFT